MTPVVLVTGASSGIGEGLARAFHQRGMDVVLVARRRERLLTIAAELNALRSGSASIQCIDLTREHSNADGGVGGVAELEAFIRTSRIDILVNNAGFGSFGEFADLELAHELRMIALNVAAPTRLAHAVLPQLRERRQGALIWTSSVAAVAPLPYMSTYSATKGFELSQVLSLWRELKPYGVHVMAICPGPTATEFSGVARVPGTVTGLTRDTVQAVVADALRAFDRRQPMVVPCWGSWFLALLARFTPLTLSVRVTERLLRTPLLQSRTGSTFSR